MKTAIDHKITKLITMREDVAKGEVFLITRLTSLKSIFETKAQVNDFASHVTRKTLLRISKTKPKYIDNWGQDIKLIKIACTTVRKYLANPKQASTAELRDILYRLEKIQGWGKNPWWSGQLRIINNCYALILEDALCCILEKDIDGRKIYDMAAHYVLAFSNSFGRDITKKSLPYIDDILIYLRKNNKTIKAITTRG
ncbi:MAG TPA: hypothetical protein VFG06_07115 [Thermodesulfovibrionales bacterium]|nr:hypothetical protein [Thermodesulfovibrionales bacterium]